MYKNVHLGYIYIYNVEKYNEICIKNNLLNVTMCYFKNKTI